MQGMEENTQQLVSLAIAAGVQRFEASLSSTANEGTARLDLLGEAVRGSKRAPYIVLIVDPRGETAVHIPQAPRSSNTPC